MAQTKHLTGRCSQCGGPLSFPAESIGLQAPCPHCGKAIELLLALPEAEPIIPRRMIVWLAIALLILVGGVIGLLAALKMAQNQSANVKPPPASQQGR